MKLEKKERIGKLTLVGPTDRRENGYVVWECLCDCGNTTFVSSKKLRRGTVKNCGCEPAYLRKHQNMVGKRVGMLTVDYLSDERDAHGRPLWHLKCDCGGERLLTAERIRRGKRLNCGCESYVQKANLAGWQFGNLTAVRPTEKRASNGSVIWECVCKCGNTVEASEDALAHGNRKSCGCLKKKAQENIAQTLHHVDGTCIERLGQKPARKDNKSGVCGVHRTKSGRFRASIGLKNKRYYLGTFDTLEEAVKARMEAVHELHTPIMDAYLQQQTV